MHSSNELDRNSFVVEVDGVGATFDDLFPDFTAQDRLGVVVRQPCGAVGASCLLLAAVTAFYDIQRARGTDFFIYPDYFLFEVGGRLGDHSMLDVWPDHKEVVVADRPEEILRAINDRAITRLVVEDGDPVETAFERESLASARDRITSALAYSPGGRVTAPDVRVTGNEVTESYVNQVLDSAPEARAQRAALREDGRPLETYRRLTLEQALALLGT
jgi:hypothetical protein